MSREVCRKTYLRHSVSTARRAEFARAYELQAEGRGFEPAVCTHYEPMTVASVTE